MEDCYIKILEFGRANINSGVLYNEIIVYLRSNEIPFNEKAVEVFIGANFEPARSFPGARAELKLNHTRQFIASEGYFNLLKYYELKEAFKASEDAKDAAKFANNAAEVAKKDSKKAIFVAVAGLVVSIIVSFIQIISDVKINPSQLEQISTDKVVLEIQTLRTDIDSLASINRVAIKTDADVSTKTSKNSKSVKTNTLK